MNAQDPIAPQTLPPITLEILKKYAMASGDYNPIHQDAVVARAMGLPGVIAHGMLTSGYLAERARKFLIETGEAGRWKWASMQTRFKAMTFLGDTITISGSVREAAEDKLTLELSAHKQSGELTTTAIVRFISESRS